MRHPTTGISQDDLSRLTRSSSSTNSVENILSCSSISSSSSSSPTCSAENSPQFQHKQKQDELNSNAADVQQTKQTEQLNNQKNAQTRFCSNYLPEIINPLEWQKSRKRKERRDSNSSTTQDRKLQRSNSEELLPQAKTAAAATANATEAAKAAAATAANNALNSNNTTEVIRRVCSEDFRRSPYVAFEKDLVDGENTSTQKQPAEAEAQNGNENDASLANCKQPQPTQTIYDALPWLNSASKDAVHRSRHETSPARSQHLSPVRGNGNKQRDSDDSECEHERRRSSERFCKSRAPPGRKAAGVLKKRSTSPSKYMPSKRGDENVYKYDNSDLKYERRGFVSKKTPKADKTAHDLNDNNLIDFHQSQNKKIASNTANMPGSSSDSDKSNKFHITIAQEALPWVRSVPEDQAPVLSRRYAPARHHHDEHIDAAAKLSKIMPYQQKSYKQTANQLLANDMDDDGMEPLTTYRAFTSLENMRTSEVMQQVLPAINSYQKPEERLKQVNKRLNALKKKLVQLEEAYETRMGYRPSQAERLNDKYMKNTLAELSKLRKERQELRTDPMAAMGFRVQGGMDANKKLDEIKKTLKVIEESLTEKRAEAKRTEVLENLTADQLMQEKTAVQHGLLYFESLYGRPATKEERDAARPIYDRYRQLKRMVSRSVTFGGTAAAGAPELPTILEHEAMVFESTQFQYSSNNSTDTSNSPTDPIGPYSDDSATTTTTTATAKEANAAEVVNENVSECSLEQLWEQLEKTREEKKSLKRIIREFESIFEEENGRKMLKSDRKTIEETYAQYKEKKAKTRLLQALIKKHISR